MLSMILEEICVKTAKPKNKVSALYDSRVNVCVISQCMLKLCELKGTHSCVYGRRRKGEALSIAQTNKNINATTRGMRRR